jgi:cytochrome P450
MGLVQKLDEGVNAIEMGVRLLVERVETGMIFNPMRADLRVDPHPYYRELRERDPIHRSRAGDGWVLTRYDDVHSILADRSFSADERNLRRWKRLIARQKRAGLSDPYEADRITMLRSDAPDHTRVRNLVNKAFTPRAVESLRSRIEGLIDEMLGRLEGATQCELVADFAAPLPVIVIAEMLGIPLEDRARFTHWSDEVVRGLGDNTLEDRIAADRAHTELRAYLRGIADARRAEPRDDLLSALVAAEEEGDKLTMAELLGTVVLLLVAGNETTTKLICNSLVALLRHPEQLELLRSEPKRIPGAVDELLRFDGPVQFTSRIVTRDRDYHGHAFQRGQQIVLILAAANRDPEHFDDPDRLDVTRDDVRHLAFGHGAHFCMGSQLARIETSLALEALLTRLPTLQLRTDAPIEWGSNVILRGPTRLPLSL